MVLIKSTTLRVYIMFFIIFFINFHLVRGIILSKSAFTNEKFCEREKYCTY